MNSSDEVEKDKRSNLDGFSHILYKVWTLAWLEFFTVFYKKTNSKELLGILL